MFDSRPPVQLISVKQVGHEDPSRGHPSPITPSTRTAKSSHTHTITTTAKDVESVTSAERPRTENGNCDGVSNFGFVADVSSASNLETPATQSNPTHPPTTPTLTPSTGNSSGTPKNPYNGEVKDAASPKIISNPSRYQVCILFLASFSYLVAGMGTTWPSTLTAQLTSDNTTFFHTQINPTQSQLDWIGSSSYIGMVLVLIPGGWVTNRLGRRNTIITASFFKAVAWLMLGLAPNVQTMFVFRMVLGMGLAGLVLSTRTYIAEMSSPSIRGRMTSLLDVMKSVGHFTVTALAIVTSWYNIAFINAAIMFTFAVLIIAIFPESPTFLLLKGKEREAHHVLLRLRAPGSTIETELKEIQVLNHREDGRSGWRALMTKDSFGNLMVVFGLFCIVGFNGSEIIKVNVTRLLQNSGIPLDPSISAVIVMASIVLGSFAMIPLVDYIGRRWCFMISLGCMVVSFCVLGGLEYAGQQEKVHHFPSTNVTEVVYQVEGSLSGTVGMWVSLVCFVTTAFAVSSGMVVPFVLVSEYFPTNTRSQAIGASLTVGILLMFLCLQLYSIMQTTLTTAGLYWTYAAVSALGIVYTPICLRETNQMSVG